MHLRAQHVAARAKRALPSPEAVAMAATAWVMSTPRRFRAGEFGLRLGRLLGQRGRIRRLPPPLSAWTNARDLPLPPRQTFRQWWRARGHDQSGGQA